MVVGGGIRLLNRRRLTATEVRRLIEDPLSSLTSSGFYVVTTVTGGWEDGPSIVRLAEQVCIWQAQGMQG